VLFSKAFVVRGEFLKHGNRGTRTWLECSLALGWWTLPVVTIYSTEECSLVYKCCVYETKSICTYFAGYNKWGHIVAIVFKCYPKL
jgi:hypothetical protein